MEGKGLSAFVYCDTDAVTVEEFKRIMDKYGNEVHHIPPDLQTADVVKVVRCKDCKYHSDEEPGLVYCPDRVGGWVDEDFFCRDGDRRIEDGCTVIPGSGTNKPDHPGCSKD